MCAQLLERSAVGKPRDLQKYFDVADEKMTPYISQAKKGQAPSNVKQEWPVDNYPSVNIAGHVDGEDVGSSDYENLYSGAAILSCYLHWSVRVPSVGHLASLLPTAGLSGRDAVSKMTAKGLTQLKRDMEAVACGDNETQADNGTVPYETRGMFKWLQNGAQSVLPVDSNYRTPTAQVVTNAIDTIDDKTIRDAMQSLFLQTGNSKVKLKGHVGDELKKQLSELLSYDTVDSGKTLVRRFNQNGAEKKVVEAVDILENDFGIVQLELNSFINKSGDPSSAESRRSGFIVPEDKCEVSFLETARTGKLPFNIGGERVAVWAIWTHKMKNPLCGINLSPAAASTS